MDIKATQKFLVTSPKKLREVAYLLRSSNLSPSQALERLELVEKRASGALGKVLKTALANAKQAGLNLDELGFKEIIINDGPVLKRFRAGSRGRAKPYKKRMSHIKIILKTLEVNKKETKEKVTKEPESKEVKKTEKVEKKVTKKAKNK